MHKIFLLDENTVKHAFFVEAQTMFSNKKFEGLPVVHTILKFQKATLVNLSGIFFSPKKRKKQQQ